VLLRSLATASASLLLVAAVLAVGFGWIVGTTSGMNSVIAVVNRIAPLQLETVGAFGALAEEFGFAKLKVTVGTKTVEASDVRARLGDWRLQPLGFDFAYLHAGSLRVHVITDPEPIQNIGVPLPLTAERATLGSLTVIVDGKEVRLQSIEGRVTAGPGGYRVAEARWPSERTLRGRGRTRRAPALPLQAQGEVTARVQDKTITAAVRVAGSLEQMSIDGTLSGAGSGTASAVVASFDKPAVRWLSLDLAGIDPRAWHPAAPTADLTLKGKLTPNAAMDRVAGSIAVENRAPGLLDAGRIPARQATAQVEIDATQLKFDRIAGQLLQGSVTGDYSVAFADGSWQSSARLTDVDPARLHGALQPLRVDGRMQARRTPQAISVTADLLNRGQPAAALTFDGRFTSALATINSARLAVGDGFVTAAGSIELAGTTAPTCRARWSASSRAAWSRASTPA